MRSHSSTENTATVFKCAFSLFLNLRDAECHQKRRRVKLTVRLSCHGDGE